MTSSAKIYRFDQYTSPFAVSDRRTLLRAVEIKITYFYFVNRSVGNSTLNPLISFVCHIGTVLFLRR